MDATYICHICNSEVKYMLFSQHDPICYLKACKEFGLTPKCTCPLHNGLEPHTSDSSTTDNKDPHCNRDSFFVLHKTKELFLSTDSTFKKIIGISKESCHKILQTYLTSQYKVDNEMKLGKRSTIKPMDKIIIILYHIRNYCTDQVTSFTFGIGRSTVEQVKDEMLKFLSSQVNLDQSYYQNPDNFRISRVDIFNENTVERERETLKWFFLKENIIAAIDATDVEIETPKNHRLDTLFYSVEKKQHSINRLFIVSAVTGKLIYMSKGYPGSVTVDCLVKETYNDWCQLLEGNDAMLGDAGFNDMENISIITPTGDESDGFSKLHSKYLTIAKSWNERCKLFECLHKIFHYPSSLTDEREICNLNDMYWRAVIYVYFDVENTR